ncbi:MAG: hypothetical protein IJ299_05125, partial [Oscillospiraceae bacterium]|nr:hypothetical protein [Oscillospiraceae bacterium]
MKKILSIILATAMLLALCPMAFAEDSTTQEGGVSGGYTYKLTDEVLAETNIAREDLEKITENSFIDESTAPWRYAGDANIGNAYAFNGLNILTSPDCAENKTGCVAIELDVKQGGTYISSLSYVLRESGPIVDVYLVKADHVSGGISTETFGIGAGAVLNYINGLDDEYKLGKVDMYSSTDGETSSPFTERELTAGKYYLLIRTAGTNIGFKALSDTYLYITLKSFTLSPAPKKLTYKFTRGALNSDVDLDINTLGTKTLDDVDANVSAPWRMASDSCILTTSSLTYLGQDWLSICTVKNYSDSVFAIELDDVRTGAYVPTLEYSAYPSSAVVNIYLVEEGTKLGNYSTDLFEFKGDGTLALNLYLFTHHYDNKLALQEQPGIYVLQENLDMTTGDHVTKTENFKEVSLKSGKKYYLICGVVSASTPNPEIFLKSFSLTPVEDAELTEAFEVEKDENYSYTAPTVTGLTSGGTVEVTNGSVNGTFTLTAPITNEKGSFLYWAKGMTKDKKIVS